MASESFPLIETSGEEEVVHGLFRIKTRWRTALEQNDDGTESVFMEEVVTFPLGYRIVRACWLASLFWPTVIACVLCGVIGLYDVTFVLSEFIIGAPPMPAVPDVQYVRTFMNTWFAMCSMGVFFVVPFMTLAATHKCRLDRNNVLARSLLYSRKAIRKAVASSCRASRSRFCLTARL